MRCFFFGAGLGLSLATAHEVDTADHYSKSENRTNNHPNIRGRNGCGLHISAPSVIGPAAKNSNIVPTRLPTVITSSPRRDAGAATGGYVSLLTVPGVARPTAENAVIVPAQFPAVVTASARGDTRLSAAGFYISLHSSPGVTRPAAKYPTIITARFLAVGAASARGDTRFGAAGFHFSYL